MLKSGFKLKTGLEAYRNYMPRDRRVFLLESIQSRKINPTWPNCRFQIA